MPSPVPSVTEIMPTWLTLLIVSVLLFWYLRATLHRMQDRERALAAKIGPKRNYGVISGPIMPKAELPKPPVCAFCKSPQRPGAFTCQNCGAAYPFAIFPQRKRERECDELIGDGGKVIARVCNNPDDVDQRLLGTERR